MRVNTCASRMIEQKIFTHADMRSKVRMEENMDYINAHCAICGAGYHVCQSCLETRQFKPWRTVTDTVSHFKIFSILHDFEIRSVGRQAARDALTECDLSDLDTYLPEIQARIEEIFHS